MRGAAAGELTQQEREGEERERERERGGKDRTGEDTARRKGE